MGTAATVIPAPDPQEKRGAGIAREAVNSLRKRRSQKNIKEKKPGEKERHPPHGQPRHVARFQHHTKEERKPASDVNAMPTRKKGDPNKSIFHKTLFARTLSQNRSQIT
jgi:hypothetical protein